MEKIVEQIKAGAGITEELKAVEPMKWVGFMNNVRSAAEEIVLRELVYDMCKCVWDGEAAPHLDCIKCGIIWNGMVYC